MPKRAAQRHQAGGQTGLPQRARPHHAVQAALPVYFSLQSLPLLLCCWCWHCVPDSFACTLRCAAMWSLYFSRKTCSGAACPKSGAGRELSLALNRSTWRITN